MTSPREMAASAAALVALGAVLLGLFDKLDSWAAISFARPVMASALVAVVEAAAMAAALCLAPALSKLVRRSLGR